MLRYKLLTIIVFTLFTLNAEVEVGSISTVLYENYEQTGLDYSPISKLLITLTPQLIWKQDRNMLIINIELSGPLGSLDGSFGKDGKLEGQLKADTFYKGYYRDSPTYLKFGKYPVNLPFLFATDTTTGQTEIGMEFSNINIFYSAIFHNWFNKLELDESYTYVDEKYTKDNRVIHNFGLDFNGASNSLKFRVPVSSYGYVLPYSFYPSINYIFNNESINFNSFIGMAYRSDYFTFGFRDELKFKYNKFETALLAAHLTANNGTDRSYNYTSIDNDPLEFHYGTHFDYLYELAANIYGLNTVGLKQSLIFPNSSFWLSASSHLSVKNYTSENRENNYIGNIFSGGFKINNLWSDSTLLEVYLSVLQPGGFSIINDVQTRDIGFQLIIKLQHIMF